MNRTTFRRQKPREDLIPVQLPVCGSDSDMPRLRPQPPPLKRRPQPPPPPRLRPKPPPQRHPEGIVTMRERFHQNRIMMREKSPMSSRGQFVELPPIPSSSQPTAKPVQQTVAQQMPKEVRTMNHYKKEEEKAPEKKSAYFSPIAFGCSQPRGLYSQSKYEPIRRPNKYATLESPTFPSMFDECEKPMLSLPVRRKVAFGSTQPSGRYPYQIDEVWRRMDIFPKCMHRPQCPPWLSCETCLD
ncbi:serine/arginine repetitive matrix protein 1-like [Pimephales promelas]|uniref:serine/arginine repetitive matrix protein 1-like n=1 Tax=Pimephales promelas TaxID=90988 RepID=UPI001955F301|nr:serine/arginine repetitive matrix protein 1-like [Pimephales promelas]KAG1962213.1 hypothetical protein F2P79_004524 [Pimephales promelas]